jgi:hypothetical protein
VLDGFASLNASLTKEARRDQKLQRYLDGRLSRLNDDCEQVKAEFFTTAESQRSYIEKICTMTRHEHLSWIAQVFLVRPLSSSRLDEIRIAR